jgi:hypothetical protein
LSANIFDEEVLTNAGFPLKESGIVRVSNRPRHILNVRLVTALTTANVVISDVGNKRMTDVFKNGQPVEMDSPALYTELSVTTVFMKPTSTFPTIVVIVKVGLVNLTVTDINCLNVSRLH